MKVFVTPLMPVFLILLLPEAALLSDCPKDCSCATLVSIICFQRHSPTIPQGVPPATQSLFLFANGIEGLTMEDFEGLESLEMLDLSQNKLTKLPDQVFQPLISLRNLDLSSNQITYISENCFHGMPQLERLYLYSNHIKTIHPAAFNGLEQLIELKLQGNQLTTLPALSLPRLRLLDLRHNVFPTLGPEDLHTPNLESLKLAGVGLTHLDDDLMDSLGNLHDLDISDNQLETFPPALKEARGLIHLSLAGNPMGPLDMNDLQNLGDLHELDISSLSLQGLPENFPKLFPHIEKLKVAENPFNCLCNLAWFPKWLRTQDITLHRTEETRCHFPPISAGKVLQRMEHSDFGCPTTTIVITTTVRTTTAAADPVTSLSSTSEAILNPLPSDHSLEPEDDDSLPPVLASPSSSSSMENEVQQTSCHANTCANGGTCRLDGRGQVECTCQPGTSGVHCEIPFHHSPSAPEAEVSVATVVSDEADISSRAVTSTTIRLDLHRYIAMRPYIRGIRLTYRNLSGPDRRPIDLSVPANYREYTLRGLKPNSTYAVCARPLGTPMGMDSSCTEARTVGQQQSTIGAQVEDKRLTTMLVPALAILLSLVLIAAVVGVVCYRRRRRGKGRPDRLDHEPPQPEPEPEGPPAGPDSRASPRKQPDLMAPEPAVQNTDLEYEVLLLQDNLSSNNNMCAYKPFYC